jgi:hypothetical protein
MMNAEMSDGSSMAISKCNAAFGEQIPLFGLPAQILSSDVSDGADVQEDTKY